MSFEDDEHGPGAAKARAEGEAWVAEGSDERREYSVLARQAPFDWAREEARQRTHEPSRLDAATASRRRNWLGSAVGPFGRARRGLRYRRVRSADPLPRTDRADKVETSGTGDYDG
jgi:hypothetical protein